MHYPPLVILCSSISTILPFLATATIVKDFGRYSKSLIWLSIFFAFAVVAEITLFVFTSLNKQSAWIFHVYTFIEYILIMIVLANWQHQPPIAKLMRMSIPIYIFFFIFIKVAGLENFETGLYNTITRPLAVLLLSAFAILTLQALWRHTQADLTSDYRFWMLLAMVLYYSASLVLFAFMFTKDRDLLIALFKIHAVLNIIHNILFTIGVFRIRATKQIVFQPTSAS